MARVQTPDFSGRSGMWVQWQDVQDFSTSLSAYPIKADSPVTGEWGFGEHEQYRQIIKIAIGPKGATGDLLVDASLANYYDPALRCSARFQTDYPSVSNFRNGIESMMHNRSGRAVLEGSEDVR
ncbi:hypothetical protein FHS96_002150 [Sphingomonas zeicaulis]|uniref:hypothetical protein n=1 Tax=Sphingomonas zeicaulis TaxID=1632740 RepID=UPI003D1AF891